MQNDDAMLVRYIGPDIGIDGLFNNHIYEVLGLDEVSGALRVVDESGEDYLYDPKRPRAICCEYKGGRFEIIRDKDNLLKNAIFGGNSATEIVAQEDTAMDTEPITSLDGSVEETTKMLKKFLGLRPDQTFQDLDVDIDDDEEQVFCPLVDEEISTFDCMITVDISDKLVIESHLPDKFKQKENWKEICRKCKYYNY